jgi:hypothetical protein
MIIGPSISDAAGNAMNEDGDAVNGEVPDDRYTVSFVLGDVQVLRSNDVPVALPMFSTSTSTLTVDQDLSIADLDVQLDISYPDAGLLGLTVISPTGTRVSLATSRDFLGPNYEDTIFDDEAEQSINEGTPPFSGSYRPATPLSVLDNTSTQGTWVLEVRAPWFFTGSLNAWSLRVIPHPPRLSVADIGIAEGDFGATSAVLTISLSHAVGDAVTVDFAAVDGTATAGSDYDAVSGSVTFAPGELTKLISVAVHGDTINEPDENFFVNLSNATNAAVLDAQAEATIRNDEARLSVNDVTLVEGAAGTTTAVFTLSLSAASSQTISVGYSTENGTATSGSDYSAASGVLVFAPGETSKTIAVTVNGDALNEADETFWLNLSGVVNAVIDDALGVGTIRNDDPLPTLSVSDVAVTEGNAGTKNLNFSVRLSAASGRTVSVDYATLAGSATEDSDFAPISGTLTFSPGQLTKTLSVVVNGDALAEADETFLLRLTDPANAVVLDAEAAGTIDNDDTLVSISDVSIVEGDTGFDSVALTVSLATPVDFEVRVNYATANGTASAGTDYVGSSGAVVLAPGVTNQTIAVLVLGDLRDELSESFYVNLSSPVNAQLADSQGSITIADNDSPPNLFINDAAISEGNSGTKNLTFTARLAAISGQTVTVQYATGDGTAADGSDYVGRSGMLTFVPGVLSQTISITIAGDTQAEQDETLFLRLSNPTNATLSDDEGQGTIQDDDNLSISDVAYVEQDAGGGSALFTVSLAVQLSEEMRLDYSTANGTAAAGSDYHAVSGTLVFAPGETSQVIAVPVIGDRWNEADETFNLILSNPVNILLVDTQAVATITNDDALPEVSVSDAIVGEGNSGTRNLSFVVRLSAVSGRAITVQYATADGTAAAGSDYVARTGTLTFSAGSISQTVNVTVNGDVAQEGDETIQLNLLNATSAFIADSQGEGIIGNDDPLSALAIGDAKVTEGNAGTKNLSFSVTLSAASSSPVTVNYATLAGSAVPGSDFNAASGVVTFNPGQVTRSINVVINGDALVEADESFVVGLANPTGAIVLDGEGLGTILNDDVTFSISDPSVSEGNDGVTEATFTVSIPFAVDFEVGVNYATANGAAISGSDYASTSGTLVFAPGGTSQTVSVLILNDLRNEVNETIYLNLSNPWNAQVIDSRGVATIVDNDALPGISISSSSVAEGSSGTKTLTFTVSLSAASGRTVTVQYATANGGAIAGADYVSQSGTLTFLPGAVARTFSVTVNGDTSAEFDETFVVTLSNPTSATLLVNQAQGTILDDDNMSVGDVVLVEGDSGVINAVFTVALAIGLPSEVRIDYATANGTATAGSDYLASTGTVIFAAGETSQTISVPVLGDRWNEIDETINLNLINPVGVLLSDSQAVTTISNDDPLPTLSISDATVIEGNAGTKTLSFTVNLSAASGRSVTVQYATADDSATAGSDYIARNGTLTFLAGATSQTFTVTVNGDTTVESNERLLINLFSATNAVIADGAGDGLILNDDEENQMSGARALIFEQLGSDATAGRTLSKWRSRGAEVRRIQR